MSCNHQISRVRICCVILTQAGRSEDARNIAVSYWHPEYVSYNAAYGGVDPVNCFVQLVTSLRDQKEDPISGQHFQASPAT